MAQNLSIGANLRREATTLTTSVGANRLLVQGCATSLHNLVPAAEKSRNPHINDVLPEQRSIKVAVLTDGVDVNIVSTRGKRNDKQRKIECDRMRQPHLALKYWMSTSASPESTGKCCLHASTTRNARFTVQYCTAYAF